MTEQKGRVPLSRAERTLLVDALEWYRDDATDDDELKDDIDECIRILEDRQELDLDVIDTELIRSNVLQEYSQELRPVLGDSFEDPQRIADFYEEQFKNISQKIQAADNPFY